jgi:DNA polymerase elongation subunit (family B)
MFVDAKLKNDRLYVSEYDDKNEFQIQITKPSFIAYEEDDLGTYRSITGKRLRKVYFPDRRAIIRAKESGSRLWESDINPVFRYLEKAYPDDTKLPPLRITIFDIEVDRDPILGYSTTDNPFNPITSITLYHKWIDQAITIAVPPPNMTMAEAIALVNQTDHPDGYGVLSEDQNYYLVSDEETLLDLFADLIKDTDVISGWNSQLYDLPYIINRARVVKGYEAIEDIRYEDKFQPNERSEEYLTRLSAFPILPDVGETESYGRKERTFEILGRRHVDYLVFYKKFVKAELASFSLDAILEHEVKQNKVKYDGSIDEFYRNEFRRFLVYNRQDVMGLSAIDDKRRLIDLANQMIHMSGVTFDKAAGSVAKIEQAVLRELHRERGEIAWDRIEHEIDTNVPGAFVVDPRPGKHGWGCSIDASSLYPTMIRLLNISPETMVGQLDTTRTDQTLNEYVDDILKIPPEDRQPSDRYHSYRLKFRAPKGIDDAYKVAWRRFTGILEYHDVIDASPNPVKLILLDGTGVVKTGKEMRDFIQQNNFCITANGTVFTLDKEGIIPYCLTKWYNDRQVFRGMASDFEKKSIEAEAAGDKKKAQEYARQAEYYNMVQEAKKIFLNSTYGAYLNRYFRFYDARCGRSVTLSGRVVIKHMCRKSCELLTGKYDFEGSVILAGDTDSSYISLESFLNDAGVEKTPENVIEIADWLADQINESFIEHLSEQFLVPKDRVGIVQVKRETVYDRAIFKDAKKRYAMHIVDKEGKRIPKGHRDELKVVGMETRRTDTPAYVQVFLQECLRRALIEGDEEEELRDFVQIFREQYRQTPSWKRGSPVRLNKLQTSTGLMHQFDKERDAHNFGTKKPQIYWAVQAAANTNTLMDKFKEPRWEKLRDGDKVEVLYLKPENEYGLGSVAIRVGEEYVPEWFKALPFDDEAHEHKLIDQKLGNIFGSLGWDFSPRDHTGYSIFI